VDGEAIAAIPLQAVEVDVCEELTVSWLVEIQGTTNAEEVPAEVHACATGVEIHVLLWWGVSVSEAGSCSVAVSSGTKDGVEIKVERAAAVLWATGAGLGARGR
jgi:hypothetical protein